jgi:hypothetical protein
MRACVATVWGVPDTIRSTGSLPLMVVVRHDSLIIAFFHCDRVTCNDPLAEWWEQEDRADQPVPEPALA